MRVFTLPRFISTLGDEEARKALSEFSAERNLDVQRFIRESAIPYQKAHNSRAYLLVDDSYRLKGLLHPIPCLHEDTGRDIKHDEAEDERLWPQFSLHRPLLPPWSACT